MFIQAVYVDLFQLIAIFTLDADDGDDDDHGDNGHNNSEDNSTSVCNNNPHIIFLIQLT